MNKFILITGSSGFIGYHVAKYFLDKKFNIVGLDNHNNYYEKKIKINRCSILRKYKNFKFFKVDISDFKSINKIIRKFKPLLIINLAAQPGVRYSFINPQAYIKSNITGFTNILESMKENNINNIIYASSSSVYGDCKTFPFTENLILKPLNFYGQTKLMNEKISEIYHNNYKLNMIGLRFFTVYGPHGRPDMFIPKIINNIKKNKLIYLYNNGKHIRDFTYVSDVSEIIFKLFKNLKIKNPTHKILNVCGGSKISLKKLIFLTEKITEKKLKVKLRPFQRGDMYKTHGDNKQLIKIIKNKKFVKFEEGLLDTLKIDYFKK